MKVLKVSGIAVLLVIALVLVFATFILPGILQDMGVEQIEEITGRQVSIGDVAINPLTLTARVDKFDMKEKDGSTTFASFSSARVSASFSSLVKGMPILDSARIVSPYIHVVRTGEESFNFSDIRKRLANEETKKTAAAKEEVKKNKRRFSVFDMAVTNGNIEFIDRAAPGGTVSHTVRNIDLFIPALSTIPKKSGDTVSIQAGAVINGAPLKINGEGHPFKAQQDASLKVSLEQVTIPFYSPYLPRDIPLAIDSGNISLGLNVAYAGRNDKDPLINVSGSITVNDLALQDSSNQPLLDLAMLRMTIRSSDLAERDVNVDLLRLDSFNVYVSRDQRGVWSFKKLAESMPEGDDAENGEEDGEDKKLTARVALTQVRDGKVHYVDRSVSPSFKTDVRDLTVDLGEISTRPGNNAPLRASLITGKGENVAMSGSISANPVAFDGKVSVSGIGIGNYYPYVAEYLTAPVTGTVESSAKVAIEKGGEDLRVSDLDLILTDLYAPFGSDDFARISAIRIMNGSFDREKYTATLDSVSVTNGTMKVSRDKDGTLSPMALLKESQSKHGSPIKKKQKEKELKYSVDQVNIANLDLSFRDASRSSVEPIVIKLDDLSAGVSNITGPELKEMPYRLSTRYGKDGMINMSGSFNPRPLQVQTHTVVKNVPLVDLAPYIADKLNVTITDGRLGADITADIHKKGTKLAGNYRGSVQLKSFRLQDAEDLSNLLVWEMLRLDDARGTFQPPALTADRVLLSEYYANVVVNKDGSINFKRKLEEAQAGPEQPEKESQADSAAKPAICIGTLTLENGVLDFKDYSLDPQRYATRFVQLGGRVSGLSSEPGTRADVDLRGALENQSPIRISGRMNPLADPLYVDLKIDFDNIALPRFSPYAAKYLGYRIEQGKLRASLDYTIEDKKIEATNRILIDQLFFGREVESEQAVSLPGPVSVPAVVGLLKGPQGKIELDVPVAGRADDPEIGIGSVVWNAIKDAFKGLFRKILFNPFSFLFGGKAEEFRTIYFNYGTAFLSDEQKQKLAGLARKMEERPELQLDVTGYVDRERDPEGYRRHILQERMRLAKYLDLLEWPKQAPQAGHIPDNVQVTDEEYPKYLKKVYEQADFPKPRNAFGRPKELPEEEMRKLLLAHTIIDDRQLRNLSRERSLAVRDFLSRRQKVDPARLLLRIGDIFKEPEQPVASAARVEFSLASASPSGQSVP